MLNARPMAIAMFAIGVLGLSLPAAAQTPETPAARPAPDEAAAVAAPPPGPDPEIMTIFGRRKPGTYPGWARIDTASGSSCGYMSVKGDDEVYDDYIGGSAGRRNSRYSVLEKAPFGSAMDTPEIVRERQPGAHGAAGPTGCGAGDFAFAAGRASIARNDTSLRDAYMAFDNKDYTGALALFQKSYTKMGYPVAALMLGKMHLIGLGTPQDTGKAVKWLTEATEGRFHPGYSVQRFVEKDPDFMSTESDAAMLLGRIYMTGWGTPKDAAKARTWHMKADKFGFVPGTYLVGRMFDRGYGGDRSIVKAVKYFRKAGEVGYAPAQYELGVILLEGADGVAAKPKEGAQWLLEAAKRGHPDGLYESGRLYDLGKIVTADPQKAIVYYKEAAVKGSAEAQTALGTYFYTGEIVGKDLVMARRWFLYAAENGDPQAMLNLGVMYLNGEGGDKDRATAYALFRLAERAGLDAGAEAANTLEPSLTPDEKMKAEAILSPPIPVDRK
jgi:TPR repeat protein